MRIQIVAYYIFFSLLLPNIDISIEKKKNNPQFRGPILVQEFYNYSALFLIYGGQQHLCKPLYLHRFC